MKNQVPNPKFHTQLEQQCKMNHQQHKLKLASKLFRVYKTMIINGMITLVKCLEYTEKIPFSCLLYTFCLCYAVLSVACSLVICCWERADPLALLCVFLCFVTFQYGVTAE